VNAGRPPFIKYTPLLIWVFVELVRDQQDPGRKRKTERDGCDRLEKKLAEDFKGGRVLPFETIRRYYRNFKTIIRRSNTGSEKALADILLKIGRARRVLLGWDASVWLLVFDPDPLEVQLTAKLLSIDPKLLSFDPNELMTH
jgi:hypothetical protein